ncbi:MAG: hypothetical protein ACM358_17065 [Gemmatimonadota bacterium]
MSDEKPCPGIGKLPRVGYYGLMTDDGERMYLSRCAWCDKPFHPSKPMPEHTIIRHPGGVSYTFAAGDPESCLEGFEALPPGARIKP